MGVLRIRNRWVAMLAHTGLAVVLMTLCRLLYYFFNKSLFSFIAMPHLLTLLAGGLHYDVAVILYGCVIYYLMMIAGALLPPRVEQRRWWQVVRAVGFLLPMSLMLVMNICDTGYYPYILSRASRHLFYEFGEEDMVGLAGGFMVQFWPLTLAFFALMSLLVYGFLHFSFAPVVEQKRSPLVRRIAGALVAVGLIVVGMRGTLRSHERPLSETIADRYIEDYREVALVLNTPYSLSRSSGARFVRYRFYDPTELRRIFDPVYQAEPLEPGDTLFGSLRGYNVMIVLMESMGREYIGALNTDIPGYESYTPFLDSLIPHTLYAKYGYANGKRSVESFPSIYASLPTFGATFNDKEFQMNSYQQCHAFTSGLPLMLRDEGYDLKFYHGDEPGAMGFYDFLHRMGLERQYTAEDFRREVPDADRYFMKSWGVFDDPFEQAMARDMKCSLREPFGAFFFSLTNHHPFQLPRGYEKRYKPGTLPIHRTAQYADEALRDFFDSIKDEPWYDHTIFVITGDHTNQSDRPEYDCPAGRSMVPICFYVPDGSLRGEISDRVVQHLDIYPTLLYLLGIDRAIYSYGHNIFDDRVDHYALNNFFDRYFLFTKELTVVMRRDGEVSLEAPRAPVQTDHPDPTLPSDSIRDHYSHLLRAIAQDYSERLFSSGFVLNDSDATEASAQH